MAEGQTQTAAATVVTFCKLALGSTALGVAFGLVSSLWLGASADITTESMITLTTAYFAYYVSDHLLHISGLLAVCTLGAVMALIAKSRISPGAQHGVELIWGALEWVANCVLFVYMGVIIALDIMAGEQQVAGGHGEEAGAGTGVSAIQGRDWALVLLMFVILQVGSGRLAGGRPAGDMRSSLTAAARAHALVLAADGSCFLCQHIICQLLWPADILPPSLSNML